MEVVQPTVNFFRQYGGMLSLAFTWGAIAWVYLAKRRDWSRKQFLGYVNFSLNYVVDGMLVMRTLTEVPAKDVWLSDLGVAKVNKAASRTTPDQPFVQLPDQVDMDFLYRAALNVLSDKCADAFVAQSMGLPVQSAEYRFVISMERYDPRTLKLRVLISATKDLETVFGPKVEGVPEVAVPNSLYGVRLRTLRAMHDLHRRAGAPGVLKLGRAILTVRK